METESLDWTILTARVCEILQKAALVSRVTDRPPVALNDTPPPWVQIQQSGLSYAEVSIGPIAEAAVAGPRVVEERLSVQTHIWSPYKQSNPDTTPGWSALVARVRTQFRNRRTLKGVTNTDPLVDVACELPQVVENDLHAYQDGTKTELCHHVLITLEVVQEMQYDAP